MENRFGAIASFRNSRIWQISRISTCAAFFLLGLGLSVACGKVPTEEPGKAFNRFVGDFESGNLDNFHFLVVDRSVNTIIQQSPVRKGSYSMRNVLRPTDYVNNGYRSELAVYNCAYYRTEVYYGFSLYIDPAYTDDRYNLLAQWQDLPYFAQGEDWSQIPQLKGSSPPLALVYVNGNFELKMNDNPMSSGSTFPIANAMTASKGVWYDFLFRIYWSDDGDGFVEARINGNYWTSFNGTDYRYYHRNLFTRAGNYFKFGQYRGGDAPTVTNTVHFDEIRVGHTVEEASP